ncbi:hypothetical protein [Streptomyces chattanoogensis]
MDWRNRAADDQIVHGYTVRYGEHSAQRLSGLGHLDPGDTPWGSA